ncbi:MAG: hypothetical protein ACYCX4_16595 [Bacillota bacterium]
MAITTEHFYSEAIRISEEAENRGIKLRILGSLAFRIHCPQYVSLLDQMKRELTDIDYVGRSDQRHQFKDFICEMGYEIDRDLLIATEGQRFFFKHPETGLGIDVFVDKLNYCHPIMLKNRLDLDRPTITLIDLFLEKMQIVEINEKDFKDTFIMLLEHDFGTGDPEKIDLDYLCSVLCNDWGFYYTFTLNIEKAKDFLTKYAVLTNEQQRIISDKFEHVLEILGKAPKTLRWKVRAKVGTKIKWYQEVNEKEPTF